MTYAIVIFVFSRIAYLLMVHPFHLFEYQYEELFRGAIARDLMHGLSMPFWEYRADDYAGGSLIQGILTVPFFALLGENIFALKLTSVAVFSGVMRIWMRLIQRQHGKAPAVFFALLFIFAPRSFIRYSLVPLGDHAETCLLTAATLGLGVTLLTENISERKRRFYWIFLGLVSGFSLWFAYIYGITMMALALLRFVHHPRMTITRPEALRFLAAFFVGFSPWILLNLKTDFEGIQVQGQPFWHLFSWKAFWGGLCEIKQSAAYRVLTSFYLTYEQSPLWRRILYQLYSAAVMAPPVLWLLAHRDKDNKWIVRFWQSAPLIQFCLLYVGIYLFILQWTSFKAQRYLTPLYPMILAVLSVFLGKLWQDARRFYKASAAIICFFLCAVSAAALASRFSDDHEDWGKAWELEGYAYYWLSQSPVSRDIPRMLGYLHQFEKNLNNEENLELNIGFASSMGNWMPYEDLKAQFPEFYLKIPEKVRPVYLYFYGALIAYENEPDTEAGLKELRQLADLQGLDRNLLKAGFMEALGEMTLDSIARLIKIRDQLEPSLLPFYWRAYGKQLLLLRYAYWGSLEGTIFPAIQVYAARYKSPEKSWILQGMGQYLYDRWMTSPMTRQHPDEVIQALPEDIRSDLMRGIGQGALSGNLNLPNEEHRLYWRIYLKDFKADLQMFAEQGNVEYQRHYAGLGFPTVGRIAQFQE